MGMRFFQRKNTSVIYIYIHPKNREGWVDSSYQRSFYINILHDSANGRRNPN